MFNRKFIDHPAAGGAEVYTREVTRRWAAAGHDVTLFCSALGGTPDDRVVDGVRVVRRGGRFGVYREARRFYRTEGVGRYDLVVDGANPRPFGCAAWVKDARVVALFHQVRREIWFHELPLPVALLGRYVLEPRWLRRYQDVPALTVSPSSRDSLYEYGLRNVVVVPVGRDRVPRPEVPRERLPTIVFLGRLTWSKRPDHALAAVETLARQGFYAQLWYIGDGPLRHDLEKAADDCGLPVRFYGRVTDGMRDLLLARAHALVVTSVREGWGLVVDEAAAMGTPTVAYDCPGLRDSVPAAGGVLVDPHPAALATGLARVLPGWVAEPSSHGWLGGAADWDAVADAVLAAAIFHTTPATGYVDSPVREADS